MFSAYELYADFGSDEPTVTQADRKEPGQTVAGRFKSAFSHKDVKVHFVGAWYAFSSFLDLCADTQAAGTPFHPSELCVEKKCFLGRLME
jgi:hypothetical protein